MTTIVKIDGKAIQLDEFVRTLKLTGQFEALLEQFVRDRLAAMSARKAGIQVSEAEIQERCDQFRRVRGLHRASDTNRYLDAMRVSLEEFEAFITDSLYQEKMLAKVCSEQAALGYFKLNSPKFDSIEVSHIVLDSEAKAKEMVAVLGDDPDSFDEMAREHSIADTREQGGVIGKVLRGSLRADVEAKVFNATAGDLLGPFASGDRTAFEIFLVNAKNSARLDEDTAVEVRRLLREDWFRARAQEHVIEAN
ncbi:MAG TPA: peptidylprolyl isomerase [Steroidobacteraceae bacterium]|jgi:peptidylprolyl isomerase|nr:peptidylprolyl isomerase [Steroidobacteraceae bacterium]